MKTLRRYKHAILLAVLLCVALVESFSHRQVLGPVLSDVAITMMLLLVFVIVFEGWLNRLVAFVALAIAVAAVWAHNVLPPSYPEAPLRLVYHSAALLLVGFATLVILRNIFEQRIVRTDDVLGAVCGYLLAAGAWANLFMLIEIFSPGSFSVSPGVRRCARHMGRAHRGTELRQPRLADEHRFGCNSASPAARHHIDYPRGDVRTVLHCSRGRATRRREAVSAAPRTRATGDDRKTVRSETVGVR